MDAVEGAPPTLTLRCARVFSGEGGQTASPAWVTISGDRIAATGIGDAPPGAVDLGDALLAPGFLDLQVNGWGAVDFATATATEIVGAVDTIVSGGTTGLLITLCSAPLADYAAMLETAAEVRTRRPDAVLGVHLEGPFLGGAPGAHPVDVLRPADLEFLGRVLDDHAGLVRLVTIAPEADPALAATRLLCERGVVVALGHSTVDIAGARAAADAGARMVTHLFNGMSGMHHRAPGLAGAGLDDERLVPSVIADFVHVHPAMVRLALRARPDAVLVTDAVASAGDVVERDGAAFLPDGTLAGSVLAMDRAVQNVVSTGIPNAAAVRHATANPARVLGESDRGRVAAGARADLVALDPETLAVRSVWVAGAPG
jgi:N-acetylglucosamine-6-phosphate deacetylase